MRARARVARTYGARVLVETRVYLAGEGAPRERGPPLEAPRSLADPPVHLLRRHRRESFRVRDEKWIRRNVGFDAEEKEGGKLREGGGFRGSGGRVFGTKRRKARARVDLTIIDGYVYQAKISSR